VTTTESIDAVCGGASQEIAMIDLAGTATSRDLLREIEGLRRALETRSVIGQAIGIVMSLERLTAEAAFSWLVARSSRTNTKLREVAAAVVAEAEARALTSE
jgi:AmiR/NasT family two-component response regulator